MSALPDLDGKVAVVTGGASGIGKGIARQLTREGARVIIADIDAGAVVVRAIKNGYLYALTHPDWYNRVQRRHQKIAEAFRVQAEAGPPTPK